MSQWIFLRHGESVANAGGFLAGWDDVPLTPLGEQQAAEAGRSLAGMPIERVVTSDLCRALRTAEIALHARGGTAPRPIVDPRFRERHLGQWSGEPLARLRADGRVEQLLGWTTAPPGGESHLDLVLRALPALAELGESPVTLMVAHGGLLRALLGVLDGVPVEEIGRHSVANAVPITRDLCPGIWAAHYERLLISAR